MGVYVCAARGSGPGGRSWEAGGALACDGAAVVSRLLSGCTWTGLMVMMVAPSREGGCRCRAERSWHFGAEVAARWQAGRLACQAGRRRPVVPRGRAGGRAGCVGEPPCRHGACRRFAARPEAQGVREQQGARSRAAPTPLRRSRAVLRVHGPGRTPPHRTSSTPTPLPVAPAAALSRPSPLTHTSAHTHSPARTPARARSPGPRPRWSCTAGEAAAAQGRRSRHGWCGTTGWRQRRQASRWAGAYGWADVCVWLGGSVGRGRYMGQPVNCICTCACVASGWEGACNQHV